MTRDQALKLIVKIQREEPGIDIWFDERFAKKDGQGYRIELSIRCPDLKLVVQDVTEWPSIQQAWRWFLHPEEDVSREGKYLVNGQVMTIGLSRDGYWRGKYIDQSGQRKTHYFGKEDPRGRYPAFGKQEKEERKTA